MSFSSHLEERQLKLCVEVKVWKFHAIAKKEDGDMFNDSFANQIEPFDSG